MEMLNMLVESVANTPDRHPHHCQQPQSSMPESSHRKASCPSTSTSDRNQPGNFNDDVLASIRRNLAAAMPPTAEKLAARARPTSTSSNTPGTSLPSRSVSVPSDSTQHQSGPSSSSQSSSSLQSPRLRVRFEYQGVRRAAMMPKPLRLEHLQMKIRESYPDGDSLIIKYTIPTEEVLVTIDTQKELDQAVDMLQWSGVKSLRLLLHKIKHKAPSPSENTSVRSLSPGPGARKASSSSRRPIRPGGGRSIGGTNASEILRNIQDIPYKPTASSKAQSRVSVNHFKYQQGQHWVNNPRRAQQTGKQAPQSSNSSGIVPDVSSLSIKIQPGSHAPDALGSATSPQPPLNWRVGKLLGKGTFGSVYQCYDVDRGKWLAVKSLSFHESNQKSLTMVENEVNLLSHCEHDRIVAYLGTEHKTYTDALNNNQHALLIFMEFMAGGSVKDRIKTLGPLTEQLARRYTAQVLQGLDYLHRIDIVHRDIKCANILLDESGENAKIGDFGSSKLLKTTLVEDGVNETMERTKSTVGTIYYMAPEVVMNIPYARRADVWSTGCSLVEMLTGRPPWTGLDSELAVMLKIASSPAPEYTLPDEITEVTRELLSLMFIKDFQQRPYAWDLLNHAAVRLN